MCTYHLSVGLDFMIKHITQNIGLQFFSRIYFSKIQLEHEIITLDCYEASFYSMYPLLL